MTKGDETESVDSSVWNVWNDPEPTRREAVIKTERFGRVIRLLDAEIRFLEDFPDKAEGGAEGVPDRVRDLEEAIAILEREGSDAGS